MSKTRKIIPVVAIVIALLVAAGASGISCCWCSGWGPVNVSWTGSLPGTWNGNCVGTVSIPWITLGTAVQINSSMGCSPCYCHPTYTWSVTKTSGIPEAPWSGTGSNASFTPAYPGGCFDVVLNAICEDGAPATCSPCTIQICINRSAYLLEQTINGTLYTVVDGSGTTYVLSKSTNGGYHWDATNAPTANPILDIACSPVDANKLYILVDANPDRLYKTTSGGASFVQITLPTGAWSSDLWNAIDVGYNAGHHYIFAANRTAAPNGDVFYLDEEVYGAPWIDMNANVPVYEIACSPKFETEVSPLILAVVRTGAGNVEVWNKYGTAGWNAFSLLMPAAVLFAGAAPLTGVGLKPCIAFVDDFDSTPGGGSLEYWVSMNNGGGTGQDGLWRVFYATANLPATVSGIPFTSVDVAGSAFAAYIMGGTNTADVWNSLTDGTTWSPSITDPVGPGNENQYVVVAYNYLISGRAWALVHGITGGLSLTIDYGANWSLIW